MNPTDPNQSDPNQPVQDPNASVAPGAMPAEPSATPPAAEPSMPGAGVPPMGTPAEPVMPPAGGEMPAQQPSDQQNPGDQGGQPPSVPPATA